MNVDPTPIARALALLAAAVTAQLSAAAAGQEMPSIDYNGALDHARTTGRLVRQAQQREGGAQVTTRPNANQRAACSKKKALGREHGMDHPKVQKLYALCRQVGL